MVMWEKKLALTTTFPPATHLSIVTRMQKMLFVCDQSSRPISHLLSSALLA